MFEIIRRFYELISEADRRLGIAKILMYTFYIFLIVVICNWKTVLIGASEFINAINKEKHDEAMKLRDETNSKIYLGLVELRARVGADRIILLEYHNTVTNLVGLPFKFLTLSHHDEAYGVGIPEIGKYDKINSSILTGFLTNLSDLTFLKIDNVNEFKMENAVVFSALNNPDSKKLGYIYLRGIDKPVGIIVIEWIKTKRELDWDVIRDSAISASFKLNSLMTNKK